jgi:aminoacrylate peracid reductase
MPISPVIPPGSPPPLAPYSPGMRAGDWLFVSGTLALGPKGEVVGAGDVAAQTRHVLSSIKAVVEAAGGTMATIVYNQIFLKDLGDYAAMNKVYAEFFPAKPPARYCIRADLVKPDFLVEIASTAYLGR